MDEISDWVESADTELPESVAQQVAQASTAVAEPEPEAEAPAEPESAEESPEDGRDDQGRFKGRHRSRRQQAAAKDVPRIQELTRRLRETERQLEAEKARASATKPVEAAPTRPAAPATPSAPAVSEPSAETPQPRPTHASKAPKPAAFAEPEPKEADFDDYGKYMRAISGWEGRKAYAEARMQDWEAGEKAAQQAEQQAILTSWQQRVAAAQKKYPDFTDVALTQQTRIEAGSVIDAWIMEHAAGADVLYYLQSHPDEVDALKGRSVLAQVEGLTLLAQRLTSSARRSDAQTGSSATAQTARPAPRPPNPVRTGPMKPQAEVPSDEDSLEAHEAYFYGENGRRRRR